MVAAIDAGDLSTAREIHTTLIPAVREVMSSASQGAIRAKAALQLTGVLAERTTRLPLLPAPDADLPALRRGLEEAQLL
jgi:4-hydroxy-tetrahydrodipicolinate synthase